MSAKNEVAGALEDILWDFMVWAWKPADDNQHQCPLCGRAHYDPDRIEHKRDCSIGQHITKARDVLASAKEQS